MSRATRDATARPRLRHRHRHHHGDEPVPLNREHLRYNLEEIEEEVELLLRALREQRPLSHDQVYRAFQHIIHHVNIGWNGRCARDGLGASEEQLAERGRFPDDITLI